MINPHSKIIGLQRIIFIAILGLMAYLVPLSPAHSQPNSQIIDMAEEQDANRITDEQYNTLLSFLLSIHESYQQSIGGPIFMGVQYVFDSVGMSPYGHCQRTSANLPNMEDTQRVKMARIMQGFINDIQLGGIGQVKQTLMLRNESTKLGQMFKKDPALLNGIANVIHSGVLECPILVMLDTPRLATYAGMFGTTYLFCPWIWFVLRRKLSGLTKGLAAAGIPTVAFAAVVFMFYLFFQAEIDPVIEIFRQHYR